MKTKRLTRAIRAYLINLGAKSDSREKVTGQFKEYFKGHGKKLSDDAKRYLKALYKMATGPDISATEKLIALGALVYFINPFDAIPDITPFMGFIDDVALLTAVISHFGKKVDPYLDEEDTNHSLSSPKKEE